MKKNYTLILFCIVFLSASCAAPTPTAPAPTPTPTALPAALSTSTFPPVATPTEEPNFEVTPMITTDQNLHTKDLSSFIDTWNSRNVQSIQALYSENARILTESEAAKLKNQEPVNLEVNEELIAAYLQTIPQSMILRVIGEPVMVYDKLVAYTYRIEGETEGYNAAGLLRYEGDKIYQHVFLVSDQLTSNAGSNNEPSPEPPIGQMMESWSAGDLTAASKVYAEDAIILSDEDIAQAKWRDFQTPPTLDQLFKQFSGWKPELISPPVQLEDMVIFARRWSIRSFPAGHGVRLVKLQDGLITVDIRYAIRPWEVEGREFNSD